MSAKLQLARRGGFASLGVALLCAAVGLVVPCDSSRAATDQGAAVDGEQEEGFTNLLGDDAKDHWRGYADEGWPAGWKLADGTLVRAGGGGDIMSKQEYGDFDLRLDWKISEGGNSGIIYRVSTGDPAPYLSGMECQVLDNQRHADGKNPLTSAGGLYALYAPDPDACKPAGEWNQVRIVVRGKHVQHYLNGKKVVDCVIGSDDWNKRLAASKFAGWEKFAKNDRGHFTLQDHGDEVWYRNVRIKSLDKKSAAE